MPTTVTNTSPDRRIWTRLQREDGRTLELDPGESAENVDLPDGFASPFLSVATAPRRKPAEPEPAPEVEPAPAPGEDL